MKNQAANSSNKENSTMKKKTFYHLVLDRSGSMGSCWEEAIQVIDNQLLDLKRIQKENPDSEIIFSFCAFNQLLHFSDELMNTETSKIDWKLIFPYGMTALYDAIGESIEFLKEKAGKSLEEKNSDVVMLVLTDGLENSSKKHLGPEIKNMMESCEQTEKWNFLFLAADLDVVHVTREFNRGKRNSLNFDKSMMGSALGMVSAELSNFVKSKNTETKKRKFFDDGDDLAF
jgi:uncharacterized protein YegL